jgi:hypothetical protein
MWSLAVFVPGGLVILAVWLSVRAARRQELLSSTSSSRITPGSSILSG